jgi:hypothetical protein
MGDKTHDRVAAPDSINSGAPEFFFNFSYQYLTHFDYYYFMTIIFRNIESVFG